MPIYEYRCEKCGQMNEFLVLKREEALHCKQCGSEDLTKLLSAHNTSSAHLENLLSPVREVVAEHQLLRHTGKLLFRVVCISSVSLIKRAVRREIEDYTSSSVTISFLIRDSNSSNTGRTSVLNLPATSTNIILSPTFRFPELIQIFTSTTPALCLKVG